MRFSLFPLDSSGFSVWSFQLRPFFRYGAKRVPPNDATWRPVGFGVKSWDSFQESLQARGVEFSFLSQMVLRMVFAHSIEPKTPTSKLNRAFERKPPSAIASESTR